MEIIKMTFKTNIVTDVAADEVKSAFKSDRRIWSFKLDNDGQDNLLHVAAEMDSAEVVSKINSLGFEAIEIHETLP